MLRKLISDQRQLPAADAVYTGLGHATFATAFIWSTTQVKLLFENGSELQFDGTSWGIGLAGGISWGAGLFGVPPDKLIGSCNYQQNLTAVFSQVTFWNDNGALGSFQGASIGVGGSATGGGGSWKKAS
ncbi:MAG TPA: hypothetical protein VGM86_27385 [Thermoanaerobaculia bacterium]